MRSELSRRERQAMDILYAKGRASVADVRAELPDEPTYSATRVLLQRLRKKGLLEFETDGPRYIYSPTTPRSQAGRSALRRLTTTFFAGSKVQAFSALLGSAEQIPDDELDELQRLIDEARTRRR